MYHTKLNLCAVAKKKSDRSRKRKFRVDLSFFSKDDGGASGHVEFEPIFILSVVNGVVIGQMRDGVVGQSEAAEIFIVSVEHDIILTFRDEEAVIGERFRWREIEDEDEVASHVREDLVGVVVPDFANRQLFKIGFTLHDGEHFAVEVPEPVIA